MLRKYLLFFVFCCGWLKMNAQQPVLTVNGPDSGSVKLTRLDLDVNIAGNIAITTMTMRFCNGSKRILEGELNFPMPEGVSVSRFALDMNGKMREAVPVEKEKGQVVFENIERRNVDPGLLEKTEGNNFRTRIYPIPAGGCRTVLIAYEQELHQGSKNALLYSLPMQFKYAIQEFSASFKVFSSQMPEVGSDCNAGLRFESLKNVFQANIQKNKFKPDGSFQLMMPVLENQAEVMMQQKDGQYYFMINSFPAGKIQEKKMPGALSIVWDVSLSGRLRNHQKEFDLLDKYLKQAGNVKVNLFTLGLDLIPAGQFAISGGDWSSLKKAIEDLNYDGATNFSAFRTNIPGEECLFFTDGLNTWGKIQDIGFAPVPVYPINATANADYELLQLIAAKTGGVVINLNETTPEEALTSLTRLPLQLINIKMGNMVSEVYPSIATPVKGNCAVTGISSAPQTEITLEFGYGKTVAFTQTVALDYNKVQVQQIPLDKIWAQKKIAQLNMQYDVFKNLVTGLGKKYGIVTKNTSLIVLDDVADYVQYEIEPPAELKAEYARLMAAKNATEEKAKNKTIADALKVYADVSRWWDKDFKPAKKITSYVDLDIDSSVARNMITGRITDEKGEPLVSATVKIKGTNTGTYTGSQGEFRLRKNTTGATTLVATYIGFHTVEVAVTGRTNSINITLNPVSQTLEQVVVVSRNRRQESDGDDVMYEYTTGRTDSSRTVSDMLRRTPGVQVEQRTEVGAAASTTVVPLANQTFAVTNHATSVTRNTNARRGAKSGKKKRASLGFQRNVNLDERINAAPMPASGSETYTWTASDANLEAVAGSGAYDRTGNNSGRYRDSMVVRTAVPFLRIGDSARAGTMGFDTLLTVNEEPTDGEVSLLDHDADRIYLKQMDSAGGANAYQKYLELRKDYEDIPAFYFDMSNWFLKKGDTATGIKILSGIADLGIEDHEMFKTLGYQLKLLGLYSEELNVFKKVLNWRPQEPQSYRDYALALTDMGQYQPALDTLYTALLKNFDGEISALYPGIEEIILTEINNIVALKGQQINKAKLEKAAIKNMAVDVRVVLNWNMNDTDIDLWVIDPNDEKCFYSHKLTEAGGRISNDFTRGYGPEQFMVKKALKGKYKVMLHYYGDRQQKIAGATTVMAEIFTNYGKPNQERKLVTLQMEKGADVNGIPVAEFDFE